METYLEYLIRIDHYRSETAFYNKWGKFWKVVCVSLLCLLALFALALVIYEAV